MYFIDLLFGTLSQTSPDYYQQNRDQLADIPLFVEALSFNHACNSVGRPACSFLDSNAIKLIPRIAISANRNRKEVMQIFIGEDVNLY